MDYESFTLTLTYKLCSGNTYFTFTLTCLPCLQQIKTANAVEKTESKDTEFLNQNFSKYFLV